jgi:hypothetical protein
MAYNPELFIKAQNIRITEQDILWLEKQEGSLNFKFGVIFAKPGQIMDDELFSNEVASNQFNQFLALLGMLLMNLANRFSF